MQNGKHGAIARWIQKFVGVPTRRERSRFGLTIADHATNEQVRVVKCGAVRMGNGVPEFAAFVNRARRFRRDMAGDSSRKGELLEEPSHAIDSLGNVRVD